MNNNCSNGRVDILGPIGTPLNFADKIPVKSCGSFRDSLCGNWINTPLSLLFFSKENIQILQNNIKKGVYEKSNQQYVIGEQSCDELKIIMRSIYLQNSQNLPYNITNQVDKLNNLVLEYCVKQIYNEAISYMKYKRDASMMYVLPNLPNNTSNKNNTLELKPFF
jgi:hypothetical protein